MSLETIVHSLYSVTEL